MIESYWGLQFNPFQNVLSEDWFYSSPMHEEALARLFYLLEQRHKCGLLTGSAGVGKSLLLSLLKRQARRTQRQVALVDAYGIDGHELLWKVLGELGLGNFSSSPRGALWRSLSDHMHGTTLAHHQVVLVFDHLTHAAADAILFVERMLHLPACTRGWVTTVLCSRSDELRRLPSGILGQSDLSITLAPLDAYHTAEYVETALLKSGAKTNMFSRATLHHLYERTLGIPRRINQVCNLALMEAMAGQFQTVEPDLFQIASEELVLQY